MNAAKTVDAEFITANNPPAANNLTTSSPDYCQTGTTQFLSWNFADNNGDIQSSYQIQVDDNSNFSSPEDDSGQVSSSSNSYAVPQGKLAYNRTYYWRVKVWDSGGLDSGWVNGANFATPVHAYPSPNFIWTPISLTTNQQASFTDQTVAYGGSTIRRWQWVFTDGTPASAVIANPKSKFSTLGTKVVELTATDTDGFYCTIQKLVPVSLHLPEWIEVAPTL
jgi:hypothetical protein